MRRVMLALRPVELQQGELVGALRAYVNNFQFMARLGCTFEVAGRPRRLPPEVEAAVYRIMQEALYNIRQHASAARVDVLLSFSRHSFGLLVRDDGRGFDVRRAARAGGEHLGLVGMKERANGVGGTLRVHSKIGNGTSVIFRLQDRSVRATGNSGSGPTDPEHP
jgi:signal transduction histidine kinase